MSFAVLFVILASFGSYLMDLMWIIHDFVMNFYNGLTSVGAPRISRMVSFKVGASRTMPISPKLTDIMYHITEDGFYIRKFPSNILALFPCTHRYCKSKVLLQLSTLLSL